MSVMTRLNTGCGRRAWRRVARLAVLMPVLFVSGRQGLAMEGEGWILNLDPTRSWDVFFDPPVPTAIRQYYSANMDEISRESWWFRDGAWVRESQGWTVPIKDGQWHSLEGYKACATAGHTELDAEYWWYSVYRFTNSLSGPGPRPETPSPQKPGGCPAETIDPINVIDGSMILDETDVLVPCPGINLALQRHYLSVNPGTNGAFGGGWKHSYDWRVAESNWVFHTVERDLTNRLLVVDTGDGQQFTLAKVGTNDCWQGRLETGWTATRATNGEYTLNVGQGLMYCFDSNGVLTRIADPWNNAVTLTYSNSYPNQRLVRAEHSSGPYLALTYSGDRVTELQTPSTNLQLAYQYNARAQLTNAARSFTAGTFASGYCYDATEGATNNSLTQRVNAVGQVYAYAYATNTAPDLPPRCVGMAGPSNYYAHTVSHTTNGHSADVSYDRGDTNQTYHYLYEPNDLRILSIAGPNTTNLTQTYGYEALDLTVTNITLRDAERNEWFTTRLAYDTKRHVVSRASAYCATPSNAWLYAWNATNDMLAQVTDPAGGIVTLAYTNNRVSQVRLYHASGASYLTSLAYGTNGLLAAVTNANGHWTRYGYDAWGRLNRLESQAGTVVTLSNTILGHLQSVTLPGAGTNRTLNLEPDELGRVRRIAYPDGLAETLQYDALGNLTNHVDTAGRTTRYGWLPTRKLASVTRTLDGASPQDATLWFDYDQQFNTLQITDPLGRGVETYELDIQDRPVTVLNVEGQAMSVNYGLGSLVHAVTRFDGTLVSNQYDAAGLLARTIFPDQTNTYTYLKNGLLKTAGNALGTLNHGYNLANRLTNAVGVGPSATVNYVYWPAGEVSNVTSVAGTAVYALDADDRLASIRHASPDPRPGFSLAYGTNGLLASLTCTNTGLSVAYGYDCMDRLTNITWRTASSNVLRAFEYSYDNAGMITNRLLTTGEGHVTSDRYSYDSFDRLTGETRSQVSNFQFQGSYAYDLVGNRTRKTRDGVQIDYNYAANSDRLVSWIATVTGQVTVAVDVFGSSTEAIGTNAYLGQRSVSNALAAAVPGVEGTNFWAHGLAVGLGTQQLVAAVGDAAGNVGYVTNPITHVLLTNGVYEYSTAGCVTSIVYSGEGHTRSIGLSWDGEYRVTAVATNGVECERNGYDAFGRRVFVASGDTTNWMVYDGAQVVADLDATGGLVRTYVWGPGIDNLLAMTVHTGATVRTYYSLTDHLGTVNALADETGTIVESYRYDAWGRVLGVYAGNRPLSQSCVGNRYLWQGREYSWKLHLATGGAGLYYFRARWYDPVNGRWLSNDPIGISGGVNQYVFCLNSPVNARDPFGLDTAAIGIGVSAGAIANFQASFQITFSMPNWNPLDWRPGLTASITPLTELTSGAGGSIGVVGSWSIAGRPEEWDGCSWTAGGSGGMEILGGYDRSNIGGPLKHDISLAFGFQPTWSVIPAEIHGGKGWTWSWSTSNRDTAMSLYGHYYDLWQVIRSLVNGGQKKCE